MDRRSGGLRDDGLGDALVQPHRHKKAALWGGFLIYGGGPGIRTPGTSRFNGFQDRRFRPLSQPT